MSHVFEGKTTKDAKSQRLIAVPAASTLLSLLLLYFFAIPAYGTTLLDPQPQTSTTLFGRALAVVGDLNGDGVPDLAVGAPYQDGEFNGPQGFGPPQNVGKIFLINGANLAVIRELNDPDFQMITEEKFAGQLGSSIAAVGDINGDGTPDVLAGVPHHNVADLDEGEKTINAGRAYLFSGADGTVLLTLDDPTPEEQGRVGFAVAGLGDVNADGVPDLLVGVPGKDVAGLTDVGAAYVFSGADGSLIRTLDHPPAGGAEIRANFGWAVANAGDINHDGVADALIGAPGGSKAFLFSGADGGLIRTINSPVVERKQRSFGFSVAGGKDLDGDGTPEIAIGGPLLKSSRGGVFVFKGSTGALLYTLRVPSPQTFARFGESLILSADVTGDGVADIIAGAPEQDIAGATNAGQIFVFGGADGKLFQVLSSAVPQAYAGFGAAVTSADFNGSGTATPVVGTPYQNADLVAEDGDIETHLQIGQIEIQ